MVIFSEPIKEKMRESEAFCKEVHAVTVRFINGDWGDVPKNLDFARINSYNRLHRRDRVRARYFIQGKPEEKIIIITKFIKNKNQSTVMLDWEFKLFH